MIADLDKERQDLRYQLSTLQKDFDSQRDRYKGHIEVLEEQVQEFKHSITKY